MSKVILTVVDTTGIQSYIFASNRLRENIGASELVDQATHTWVTAALPEPNNVRSGGELDPARTLPDVAAEVVYVGGGNAVVMFPDMDRARAFAESLTRKVLRNAPGLQIVVAHRRFDWETELLREVLHGVLTVDLARKKQQRRPPAPLLGLGVTAACRSTGLAAAALQPESGAPIAREVAAKLDKKVQAAAEDRLQSALQDVTQRRLPGEPNKFWRFSPAFDELGRVKGEESYIAVVHADGNRMGRHLAAVGRDLDDPAGNRQYVEQLRKFSAAVNRAARTALERTAAFLLDAIEANPQLPHNGNVFPLRPIVFGGDDVTFVCHGSYGLALAAHYLKAFEQATKDEQDLAGHTFHACAGVAVVKVHYPFARAYQLSEALCKNAKEMIKERTGANDASLLDWHFAASGLAGSLADIREREYTVQAGSLLLRPVPVHIQPAGKPSWPLFADMVDAFHNDSDWSNSRNKVKALREALRQGPDATQEFTRTYGLSQGLPLAKDIAVQEIGARGWHGARCYYFDAIEAMDMCDLLEARAAIPSRAPAPTAGGAR